MKLKSSISAFLLFVLINSIVYFVTDFNSKERIELVLDRNLKTLKTHYDILLQTQKISADTLYQSTLDVDRLAPILKEAQNTTKEQKDILRDELQKLLAFKYERAKQKGILQYQFVFKNNESFLRMHKPSKYGDDLTKVREDFKYVNKNKKLIRGFTQGKTAHGFRNTYPLYDENNIHIGAMEISFSSYNFQWFLNNVSHIHTHFLVDKKIFDSKTWVRDDLILKYSQSAESSEYMITLNKTHSKKRCIDENIIVLQPIRKEIDKHIAYGEEFSSYIEYNNNMEVVSFLPIKNISGVTVAWLVSYEESKFIYLTLKNRKVIRITFIIFSLILVYFILQQARSKQSIIQKHRLLDDMLNVTENIMFITDFKNVSFSNNKFKTFFHIQNNEDFNQESKHNIFNIFIDVDGYMHEKDLREGEHFISLMKRTAEEKRIVSVLDEHLEVKSFKINISKTNYEKNYLVTLSDITKIQQKQKEIEQKAYYDGLTNIYNRNKFDDVVKDEIARARRYNNALSMAIVDIDKFKDFNDTYGHLIGDEVLIMMTQAISSNVRETDTFARWGGEEFVILFPETTAQSAKVISEKLRKNIEELSHATAGGITASFGISEFEEGDTLTSLFKRCDDALYSAKENGRNRVEVY